MTLSEFKAWFEGYTEGLETAPTKAQFDRIKEKVKEIDGAPITQTIFVDRYRDYHWPPYYRYYGALGQAQGTGTQMFDQNTGWREASNTVAQMSGNNLPAFDSRSAMYALGQAEAAN